MKHKVAGKVHVKKAKGGRKRNRKSASKKSLIKA